MLTSTLPKPRPLLCKWGWVFLQIAYGANASLFQQSKWLRAHIISFIRLLIRKSCLRPWQWVRHPATPQVLVARDLNLLSLGHEDYGSRTLSSWSFRVGSLNCPPQSSCAKDLISWVTTCRGSVALWRVFRSQGGCSWRGLRACSFPSFSFAIVVLRDMTFLYLDMQPYLKTSRMMVMEWNLGNCKLKSILYFFSF